MKHGTTAFLMAAALLAASSTRAQDTAQAPAQHEDEGMSGNLQFLIGQRYLTDDPWKPIDSPSAFGVEIDFAPSSSPIHVAMSVQVAGESGTTKPGQTYFGQTGGIDNRFFEFSAGFLWHPVKHGVVRPFLGAGALLITAADNTDFGAFSSDNHSDQSFGWYGNAGVFFKVGDSFNIGLDGRIVRGSHVTIETTSVHADYEQVCMLIGFSWGK